MCQHVLQGKIADFKEDKGGKCKSNIIEKASSKHTTTRRKKKKKKRKSIDRKNVHTHTFVGLCRDILHQLCKHETEGESVRVCERKKTLKKKKNVKRECACGRARARGKKRLKKKNGKSASEKNKTTEAKRKKKKNKMYERTIDTVFVF